MTRQSRLHSGSVQSNKSSIVLEEQRSSSGSPPAEIPACRPGVCRLGGGMMRFAGCACLLVWDVVWCRSDPNSVQNRLKGVRSVQFACLIGSAASSFKSGRGTGAKCLRSVRLVQFIQFSSQTLPALMSTLCHFRKLWGHDRIWPLEFSFQGHGSPPTVHMCMCVTTEFKDDIYTYYFQKVHANSSLQRQIISQIQTKRSGVAVEAV